MNIQHVFSHRHVTMSDSSEMWEVVTESGERIASASTEESAAEVEIALNLCLTNCCEQNGDVVANTGVEQALDA